MFLGALRASRIATFSALSLSLTLQAKAQDIAWIWTHHGHIDHRTQHAAVLLDRLELKQNTFVRVVRMRSLHVPAKIQVIPVIQVISRPSASNEFSPAQENAILSSALRHAAHTKSGWVQLDFEAPARQRNNYINLVSKLRQALPSQVKLSVTALASWCLGNTEQNQWLSQLAADEIVPMVYSLGASREEVRKQWAQDHPSLHARCQKDAIGISRQDPLQSKLNARYSKRYWFDHERHTQAASNRPTRD